MPSRRRRRREQAAAVPVDRRGRPLPSWKWRTFPVYFALSVGLFAGYNIGLITRTQSRLENIATLVFAMLFAFALSQLATRPLTEILVRRRARQQRRPEPAGLTPGPSPAKPERGGRA